MSIQKMAKVYIINGVSCKLAFKFAKEDFKELRKELNFWIAFNS